MKHLVLLVPLLLGACSISSSFSRDVKTILPGDGGGDRIAEDMTAAQFNLSEAMRVGALGPQDQALACLNNALEDLGVGKEAPSFVPKREGVISEGAIIYIRTQQLLKSRNNNIELPPACLALIGKLVMDASKVGVKVGKKLLPGANLIPSIF